MLIVNRFRVGPLGPDALQRDLESVYALLAARPGFVEGAVGRNVDDPELWVLTTRWESVGAYRRALSSYEIKAEGVPILSAALNEPSAYEIVEPGAVLNVAEPRVT